MEWLPIESAPKNGDPLLVYGDGSYTVAWWSDGVDEWRDVGDIGWAGMYGDDGNQPTHWMPLPAPPGEKL